MKLKARKWKIDFELWDNGASFLGPIKVNVLKWHIRGLLTELEGDLDIVPAKAKNLKVRRIK